MSTTKGDRGERGRWAVAVVALLDAPTLASAAERSGVPYGTLRRWMCNPLFRHKLNVARFAAVMAAGMALTEATGHAVRKLRGLLDCGQPPVELGAANAILNQACKYLDLTGHDLRLSDIEQHKNKQIGLLERQLADTQRRLQKYEPPQLSAGEDGIT
jgi:hypothetical protein